MKIRELIEISRRLVVLIIVTVAFVPLGLITTVEWIFTERMSVFNRFAKFMDKVAGINQKR